VLYALDDLPDIQPGANQDSAPATHAFAEGDQGMLVTAEALVEITLSKRRFGHTGLTGVLT
jgi:hypothetical protein